ncbi:hypothetical protein [Brevibacillus sp. BC25]|uniref:hypothetical protein n=1 Tax=Brevibacillus sp. BC25 TaxID=1144308 RepID=UPI000271043A|nr:hypothetical protein [Brevibacillus sp. BC25]EJL23820.1 hypothetical protein PMI05_04443 [Brevibacillus sp. BC25]
MEDMLLLLFSLEDFFALVALFVGCFTSAFCLRQCCLQNRALHQNVTDTYRPSINTLLVETYPMAARQPQRLRLFRRIQHTDGEMDTYDSFVLDRVA